MFETDEWNSWVAYLTFLEKQQGSNDQREIAAVIFSVLKNRFSTEDLAKLVATAKTVERTKEFAGEWERSNWRITKRTPDEVFDLLQLKEKGDGVFESPEFMNWALYVKELNSVRSRDDDVEMAYQLYRHYGPDLERMLQQAEETAIARNDEVTKASVNDLRKGFERIKPLEERPLKRKELDKTSLEKKGLGKRLRTSPPALVNKLPNE
ncbi:unnamed protein product [Peronospora destructor]|uniref:RxLR effector PexRD54 WY domain-containing protein n=1 Tax=Peronospora destructor TaxID=86335 RepID=A0AAV0TP55_9STRA|nr:unnamed protein product [Peronospora destructor]